MKKRNYAGIKPRGYGEMLVIHLIDIHSITYAKSYGHTVFVIQNKIPCICLSREKATRNGYQRDVEAPPFKHEEMKEFFPSNGNGGKSYADYYISFNETMRLIESYHTITPFNNYTTL